MFLGCLLALGITFCSLAKWRKSKHNCSVLHKSSIEVLPLNLALNPPFCQTAVMCCPFFVILLLFLFVLYFIVKMSIPAIIKSPPTAIFQVNCSFRKKKDSANVIIMLPLSINAISETLPTFIAL